MNLLLVRMDGFLFARFLDLVMIVEKPFRTSLSINIVRPKNRVEKIALF